MQGSTRGGEAAAAVAPAQDCGGRLSLSQGQGEHWGPRNWAPWHQRLTLAVRQWAEPWVSTLYPFRFPRDEGGAGGAHV